MRTSDVPEAPSARSTLVPVLAFSAIALVLFAIQAWGSHSPRLLDGLNQFDGPEYLSIARRGYQARQLVWFPVYPMAIRGLSRLWDDPLAVAVGLTLVGGMASAVAFWWWSHLPRIRVTAPALALAAFLLYPYAWYLYGVVYSDAVFTAVCIAAFFLVERDRLLAAGLVGTLAAAGRPSGFALVLGLAVLVLERREVLVVRPGATGWVRDLGLPTALRRSAWRRRYLWVGVAATGLVGYCAWLWIRWDDPIAFVTQQRNYHTPGTASMLKQQYFDAWHQGYDGRYLATSTAQGIIVALVVLAVPAVGRRFGWGYATYTLGLALLPAVSDASFLGIGRYLIPAFPVWALLGERLARRPAVAALWLLVSAGLLGLMMYGFSRSWYLS